MNCKCIIKKKKGGGGEREEADLGQFSNSVKLGEVGRKLAWSFEPTPCNDVFFSQKGNISIWNSVIYLVLFLKKITRKTKTKSHDNEIDISKLCFLSNFGWNTEHKIDYLHRNSLMV